MRLLEKYRIYKDGKWTNYKHYIGSNGESIHIEE